MNIGDHEEAQKLVKIKDIERKYLSRVSHSGIYNLYDYVEECLKKQDHKFQILNQTIEN